MENTLATKILTEMFNYRRASKSKDDCSDPRCKRCISIHRPLVEASIRKNLPVTFVLPAFPGKSPNPEKILGPLPDYGERLSLLFLGEVCKKIENIYAPGMRIVLCSDGRVFSDVVGIKESHVTDYQLELKLLIDELALSDISLFSLDDVFHGLSFMQMRDELMRRHGKSLNSLKDKIQSGKLSSALPEEKDANRIYRGITRFLFEDATFLGQQKSRSAIQREARIKAYEVIRRSNAWSDLISEQFPHAVRLSIHPQSCGSAKLGIRLIGNESWMTPWHGVAVQTKEGHILLKRKEAESLGAELIHFPDGRPSHYQLQSQQP